LNYQSAEELKAAMQKQQEAMKSQMKQLEAIEKAMKDLSIDDEVDDPENDLIPITKQERDLALSIVPSLRQVCEKAVSITKSEFATHEFGKLILKDYAEAVQVDMGTAKDVNMKFGDLDASGHSRGAQGAITEKAFEAFFTPRNRGADDEVSNKRIEGAAE
jgi:hypothetical protein